MKRYIDADKLIEDFNVSGLFDIGELGVIIPIIEDQPSIQYESTQEVENAE